jgi:formamidopyrimidine-DNA glycosylase
MPELPEVETTKTSLLPLLEQRVQSIRYTTQVCAGLYPMI